MLRHCLKAHGAAQHGGQLGIVSAGMGRPRKLVRKGMAGAEYRVQLSNNRHPRPLSPEQPALHAGTGRPGDLGNPQGGEGLQDPSGGADFLVAQLRMGQDVPAKGNELPQCDTTQDYRELISGFVRSCAVYAALKPRTEEPVLEGVQAFLEKNYQREFSMDELAQALNLSKSYLSTYYKSKTGTNLSDRIQFFRIQKAVELLADPKLRVVDIGAMVGISNVNTFLRQFKKYTGMTPKEYRIRKLSMQ